MGKGKTATVKILGLKKDALALNLLKLSDTFDTTNTDYYRPSYTTGLPQAVSAWIEPSGLPICIDSSLVVLLSVANGLVRNGEISNTGAVNAIISCQRASLLSRFIER